MLTEEQAKEKWCPFSQAGILAGHGAVAVNRHVDPKLLYEQTSCLGSGCMAWRWGKKEKDGPGATTTKLSRAEWLGRCGLAGAGK